MNQVFIDIYNTVWKGIFTNVVPLEIERFKELFASDIVLPKKFQCEISGEDIYSDSDFPYKRYISEKEIWKRDEIDNFVKEKVTISGLNDVLPKIKDLAMFRGNNKMNSDVVENSDNIFSSSYVFESSSIMNCQKILFSHNLGPSEYLLASKNSKDCSFGIRLVDAAGVSNSFDVSYSGKSSNCYFCHDCFDLRDCMFCFHLNSKQFCIGNMQFEEQEYKQLKEKILADYFAQLNSENSFKTLRDL